MKRILALALIAVVAVSMLSAAGVVTAANTKTTASDASSVAAGPIKGDTNPATNVVPIWGTTVRVNIQVSPLPLIITAPRTDQKIGVTIFYSKNGIDPLAYNMMTCRFGRTGTEASPVSQYVSDVNHDGYKDLTLVFMAKDTGLKPGDFVGKLTGTIVREGCWNTPDSKWHCDMVPFPGDYLTVTGTAPVLVV
ncbi:MAG TPA: hypothetical protein VEG65_07950 [Candidatus Bathyarchaeia archaeon]|nr:hypothetical protein [Candidatus Bathyarchaeia archaeon]